MDHREIMNKVDHLLDEGRTALLATTDGKGQPHMRWMTPTVLKWRPNTLFAFTSPASQKVRHLQAHREVAWMVQDRALNEIIHLRGVMNVVDNPALRTELMEVLGSHLLVLWKANVDETEMVVLETVIKQAVYFVPMKGFRELVSFPEPAARPG